MLSTEPKIYRGDREIPPSTFVAPARQAPAGLKVKGHAIVPWNEIILIRVTGFNRSSGIGLEVMLVHRTEPQTILSFSNWDSAINVIDRISDQIKAGATIIEVP